MLPTHDNFSKYISLMKNSLTSMNDSALLCSCLLNVINRVVIT